MGVSTHARYMAWIPVRPFGWPSPRDEIGPLSPLRTFSLSTSVAVLFARLSCTSTLALISLERAICSGE